MKVMPYLNHTVSLYRGMFDVITSYNEQESLAIGRLFDRSPDKTDDESKSVVIAEHEFRFNSARGTWVARFECNGITLAYEVFYDLTLKEHLDIVEKFVIKSIDGCQEEYAHFIKTITEACGD